MVVVVASRREDKAKSDDDANMVVVGEGNNVGDRGKGKTRWIEGREMVTCSCR